MGGKTSTSTSQVQIPPEVLARYNSVNATAENVAQTPFQQYSTNPNAFVAPLTPTQTAGVQNTDAAAGMAQPYYDAATGFALAGAGPVNAQPLNTGAYMNPYLQTVLGSTEANVNQQNQQAMSGQTGNAMSQGFFGGDRSGIAAAVLAGQQQLTGGQLYSGIASDAYNQAMAAAQQQQGVNLGAAQANRAALTGAGEQLAGIGTGAQGAALSGAQAQLGAGQVEQQTQQAGLTALYNQFLQQQSYPFQTAQFLANIAEGTGALSGNTTTSTQPGGLFSDERLKEDMQPIGKGFDGANIYRFRYKDDPDNVTRLGFSAQEVERRHPEAVSTDPASGFKMVDYGKATDGFARAANDDFEEPRRARQVGGMSQWGSYPPGVNPMSIGELLQAQAQMYGPGFGGAGLYGGSASGMPHGGSSYVPAPMQGQPMMIHGTQPPSPPRTTAADALHSAAGLSGDVTGLENDAKDVQGGWNWLNQNVGSGSVGGSGTPFDASVAARRAATMREPDPSGADNPLFARGGFARAHRQDGGDISSPQDDNPYQAHGGPGLNIPTAETQHPQLQAAKPPQQQGGSGLMSALGAGADVASIAKAAPEIGAMASGIGSGIAGAGSTLMSLLPFLALQRGGRAGYAAGGGPLAGIRADLEGGDNDPLEDELLQHALAPPDFSEPEPEPGFAGAAGAPAGSGAAAAAAAPGFAGAGGDRTRANILALEGTGKNPSSSAVGPGQFIRSTFIRTARKVFPELASMSDDAIGALHGTAKGNAMQAQMIPALDAENSSALKAAGLPVTPVNRHIAWVLGPGGAKKVLSADPATPLVDLVGQRAVDANHSIMAGKTAGDFINWAAKGMNRAKGGFAGARRGYQTDGLVVDPDAAVDPSAGQDDDRRRLDAAPQVDPAILEQAKQAASDPSVRALAQQNRVAAESGDPQAPPAAQAAVAAPAPQPTGDGDDASGGQGPGGPRYLTDSERRNEMAQDYYASEVQRQRGPQGGGFWGVLQRNWIPLAQGFAAMEAAPTRNPLVALSQGVGAFATGEQAQRGYQLGQAKTLAELAQTGENVETGAYQGQTARTRVGLDALNAAMPAFEQQFRPIQDTKNGERAYQDLRPGHAGQVLGESEVNGLRQDFRLRMLTGAGLPTGLVAPIAGMAGASQPGAPSDRTTASPSGGLSGSAIAARNPAGPPADVHGGAGTGAGTGDGSGRPVAVPASPPQGSGSQGHGASAHEKSAPAESAGAGATTPEQRAASGAYGQVPVDVQEPDPTKLSLADGDNPDALYRDYQAGANVGLDVGWKKDRADAIRGATADAPGPILHDKNGNVVPNPYVDYNLARTRQSGMSDAAVAEQKQNQAQASAWLGRDPQVRQLLHTIDEAFGSGDPTIMSGKFADIVSEMDTNPWLRDHIPKSMRDAVTSGTLAQKAAALQDIDTLIQGGMGGAPATGLHTSHQATAAPSSPAGTAYTIAHQRWENYLYAQAHQQFVANYGNTIGDWTKANNEWTRYNRGRFYDAATEAMAQDIGGPGYFHRMTPKDLKQFPRTWQGEAVAKTWAPGTYFRRPNGALGRVPGGPPE